MTENYGEIEATLTPSQNHYEKDVKPVAHSATKHRIAQTQSR